MALLTVCTGTPTITVRDNRGQAVRTLRYNRNVTGGVATQCIERNTFNDLGQPSSNQDARFFAQGGSSPTLNFQHTPALSGQVLQTVSADAGQTQTFHDIAGRLIWQRDARGTVQTYTYDALGRPLTRSEQVEGTGPTYVRERWTYGDAQAPEATYDATNTNDPRNLNLRGQVVQHYDTAGLLDHGALGFTVQGPVQRAVRTLAQDPQAEIDWNAAGLTTHWPGVLAPTSYPTSWQYNALGQVLVQTDAAGHQRRTTYDLAGRLFSSTVTVKGGSPQSVVRTQTYNAAGQALVKQAGQGVTTTHTYEPQLTQRLLTITTTRDSDRATLQSQQYTYDPVGNVTALRDPLSQLQYFKGQAVSPDKTYTYDALYQLIQATGRQNATGTPMDTGTPAGILSPSDPVNLQSYTRGYSYDLGGNLTGINLNGTGANRKVVVAPGSNRALSNANLPTLAPGDVDTYFDAAGNANCLDGNSLQPLTWNGLNQLQSVTFVYRHDQDDTENDRECYIYGGDGQRARKTRYAKVGATYSQQQDDVIYLPGLELRRQGATKTLEVLVLDDGARLLRWTAGAPAGIANPQLRLAIHDRLGSCSLELDTAGQLITQEEYFPYGGTAVLAAATPSDVDNKTIRYSGKERDATGLYYYGLRYYQPWIGRWLNPDPAGTVDGLNLFCMVGNNPVALRDTAGLMADEPSGKRRKVADAPSAPTSQNSDLPIPLPAQPILVAAQPSTSTQPSDRLKSHDVRNLPRIADCPPNYVDYVMENGTDVPMEEYRVLNVDGNYSQALFTGGAATCIIISAVIKSSEGDKKVKRIGLAHFPGINEIDKPYLIPPEPEGKNIREFHDAMMAQQEPNSVTLDVSLIGGCRSNAEEALEFFTAQKKSNQSLNIVFIDANLHDTDEHDSAQTRIDNLVLAANGQNYYENSEAVDPGSDNLCDLLLYGPSPSGSPGSAQSGLTDSSSTGQAVNADNTSVPVNNYHPAPPLQNQAPHQQEAWLEEQGAWPEDLVDINPAVYSPAIPYSSFRDYL